MDSILNALGGLVLKALPTLILVALLHLYLKLVFFKPLGRVLAARYQATEGMRKTAEEALARVSAKTAEYEEALRSARADIYQAQEQMHRKLEQERAAHLQAARHEAEQAILQARQSLAGDVATAKSGLARDAEALADQIAATVLDGRTA